MGATLQVAEGTLLADAAVQAGIQLQMPCGGEGLCGKCRVRLAQGAAMPTAQEKRHFSAEQLAAGWRLACQTPVLAPVEVEVSETSLAQAATKILVAGQVLADFPIDPPVVKRLVALPPPNRQDEAADLDRLLRAIRADTPEPFRPVGETSLSSVRDRPASRQTGRVRGPSAEGSGPTAEGRRHFPAQPTHLRPEEKESLEELPPGECQILEALPPKETPGAIRVDWPLVRQLPDRLRQCGFRGTAVLADDRLLDFEPGDTADQLYGAAVDIGTTTLAAALIHLPTGRQLAVQADLNPQTAFGDDVISRISYAQQSTAHLEELRSAVVSAINRLIGQLADQAGIRREQIYYISLVGNTTMQHLACGITPQYLGQVPFTPAAGGSLVGPAAGLGLDIHPAGLVYVAPVIGGYVGGDIVAGMVAVGLAQQDRPTLFLDIGTNGEIVLAAGSGLYAAATAAGPAFEGARISYGMRAAAGAIERIYFNGQWHIRTIGGARPRGICGSALIDLAAELLRLGGIRPDGRLVANAVGAPEGKLAQPGQTPTSLADRWTVANGEPAFVICPAEQAGTGQPILLLQRDVRQLQLATGAIRAGIRLLLRRAGIRPLDVKAVWLAGGFGNYIRRRNAQRIGLLPPELPVERIRFLGNTALAGARLLTLSRQAQAEAERLARSAQHIDLAAEPDFAAVFAESMIFPETEPSSPEV